MCPTTTRVCQYPLKVKFRLYFNRDPEIGDKFGPTPTVDYGSTYVSGTVRVCFFSDF